MGRKTNVLSLRSQISPQQWQTYWNNSNCLVEHHELILFLTRLFKNFYLNRVFIRQTHKGLFLQIEIVGVYPNLSYPNFKNLQSCIQVYTKASNVFVTISICYLPKTLISKDLRKNFRSFKREKYFWQSLLLTKGAFGGYISAKSLASFLNLFLKRNRKRQRFIKNYIKKLLSWYNLNREDWRIQGLRIEVKGRFNPKSRTKKHILSCGAVSLQTFKYQLDYAHLVSYTIFGSLGIKVWICSNAIAAKKT